MINSCSMIKKSTCNRNNAFNTGYKDAKAGATHNPGLSNGETCRDFKEYDDGMFRADYQAGFDRYKQEICNTNWADTQGRTEGQKGNTSYPSLSKSLICSFSSFDQQKFERAYKKSWQQNYCSSARIRSQANESASQYQSPDMGFINDYCGNLAGQLNDIYKRAYKRQLSSSCSVLGLQIDQKARLRANEFQTPDSTFIPAICDFNYDQLRNAYKRTYQSELRNLCTPTRLYTLGTQDAHANKSLEMQLEKLGVCKKVGKTEALLSYTQGFNAAREKIHLERERTRLENQVQQERANHQSEMNQAYSSFASYTSRNNDYINRRSSSGFRETLSVNGKNIYVNCKIRYGGTKAELLVENQDRYHWAQLRGNWSFFFYDYYGNYLGKREKYRSDSVAPNGRRYLDENITNSNISSRVKYCIARHRP